MSFEDLTGKRFGRWTVTGFSHREYSKTGTQIYWNCVCDCGNCGCIAGCSLKTGNSQSCGCLRRELSSNRRFKDLTGRRFTKLVVDHYEGQNKQGRSLWFCICDCGNSTITTSSRLLNGTTKSCGCIIKDIMGPKLYKDIKGRRFDRLVAEEPTEMRMHRQVLWRCSCDCGGETYATTTDLINEHTRSCGCVKSRGEEEIARTLTSYEIKYKKNYLFKDLYTVGKNNKKGYLKFDFAVFNKHDELIFLVEF